MNFLSHSCKKHELHASIEFLRSRKVEAKMESSNYFKSANLLINKTRSSLLDFKQNLEQSILNLQTTKSSLDNLHASFLLVKRDGLQLNKISSNLMKDLYIINKEEEAPDFTPNFILTHNKDDKLVQVFSTLNYKPKIFDQQDITELIYLSAELFASF
ncbi:hypothetical protein HZS_2430 [Henneguya salminicola]|nr:hypothetical protein HZS_2430 [Henneguya salminicola]